MFNIIIIGNQAVDSKPFAIRLADINLKAHIQINAFNIRRNNN